MRRVVRCSTALEVEVEVVLEVVLEVEESGAVWVAVPMESVPAAVFGRAVAGQWFSAPV